MAIIKTESFAFCSAVRLHTLHKGHCDSNKKEHHSLLHAARTEHFRKEKPFPRQHNTSNFAKITWHDSQVPLLLW